MKFYDTSALLDLPVQELLQEPFLLAETSLLELEEIKTSSKKDETTKAKARAVTRLLAEHQNDGSYSVCSIRYAALMRLTNDMPVADNNDTTIMATARRYLEELQDEKFEIKDKIQNPDGSVLASTLAADLDHIETLLHSFRFVTSDLSCYNLAANVMKLPTELTRDETQSSSRAPQDYKGWTEAPMDQGGCEALAMAYSKEDAVAQQNLFNTPTNGYVLIPNADADGNTAAIRWDGSRYVPIKYKKISNRFTGDIKPLNDQQKLAFDMLQNDSVTVKMLAGTFGSGKTMLMVSSAIDMIEKQKFDKMVWIRNNIEVKNTKPLGFLPGTLNEKISGAIAGPLSDHLGGDAGLEYWINSGKIELTHLGLIRGRDLRRSIILVNEAENLTKEHMQLLLGRVGEGSMLWIDGDLKQTDEDVFERNSGMAKMVERLVGDSHFGYVYMPKTERSETARLADKLD